MRDWLNRYLAIDLLIIVMALVAGSVIGYTLAVDAMTDELMACRQTLLDSVEAGERALTALESADSSLVELLNWTEP